MKTTTEKRQFIRIDFKREVEIFPVFPSYSEDFPDLPLSGRARDISGGGIAFKTDRPLKVGSFLKLRFEMERDHLVEAFGKIVWTKETHCGLAFYPSSGIPGYPL